MSSKSSGVGGQNKILFHPRSSLIEHCERCHRCDGKATPAGPVRLSEDIIDSSEITVGFVAGAIVMET